MQVAQVPNNTLETPTLAGRYAVVARSPDAGGISTLQGVDLETGSEVTILAVPSAAVTTATRARLENELLALRGLSSPYLAPLARLEEADGLMLVVRPRIPGTTLAERLFQGPLRVLDALAIAHDVALGLRTIHQCGLLHLDVEPGNVKLPGDEEPRAVLAYTGFARSARVATSRELMADAAHYASPEEAGVLHRRIDERSDIYSAGCMLFESLYGHPPFDGASVNEVLRAQLSGGAPVVRGLHPGVPRAVEAVLGRMLATEPHDRYPSAGAVASDLREIVDALRRGEQPDSLRRRSSESRRSLTEPELIGREAELEALKVKLDEARKGNGALVLVEAESGGGKTRLLEELAETCSDDRVWVLRGHGRGLGAESPYQVLDGIVAAVNRRAELDEAFAARLQATLEGQAPELTAVMPRLASLFGALGPKPASDASREHARTLLVLTTLLGMLGTSECPALVILDDCQWADEPTVELLTQWLRPKERDTERHVLIIAALRSDELGAATALLDSNAERVTLPRLRDPQIERLVESMAGLVPPEVADIVVQAAGGSPFMAAEVLRGLVESNLLTADTGGWRLAPERMAEAQASTRAAVVVGERLAQLPEDALEILSAGAILGKQFAVRDAAELAGQQLRETLAALAEARRRHIVWFDFDTGQWAFLHDQLRERLHSRLPDATQRALHLRVARRIQATRPEAVFDLAYHFHAAGEPEHALPYALAAAADARARYSLEIAQHHYAIALEALASDDRSTRRTACEGLGEISLLRGRYDEAERHFTDALDACDDGASRAHIESRLGELAFKRGDVMMAAARHERALRLLGEGIPRRRAGFVLPLLREIIIQLAHTLLPRAFVGRRAAQPGQRDLLAARLCSELSRAYWYGAGRVPCGWAHLRGMNLAERYPPTAELARAYSEHAPVMSTIPWFRRGIDYARRSIEIRRELGDRWGEGQSLLFYGGVLYSAGRVPEALESCQAAEAILERTGDQGSLSTARWHIAACYYRLGRLAEAAQIAQEVHRWAVELGDVQAAGISLGFWAKAASGEVPRQHVRDALRPHHGDVHTAAEVLQAEALGRLAASDPAGAIAALERADELIREASLRDEYVAPVPAWLATALRAALTRETALAPKRRAQLLRRARRAARRAHRIARRYPNNLPHALREQGMLAACSGRTGRARRFLDRSLEAAELQGATAEYAETLAARGAVGVALGWREGDDQLTEAIRMTGAMAPGTPAGEGEEATLSLADRFATVLEAGRSIAAALTDDAVFEATHDATVALLRVQSCTVFAVQQTDSDLRLVPVAGEADQAERLELALQALADGRPVATFEDLQGGDQDSGQTASALCATVLVRGEAKACICATYSGVPDLFDEEGEQLATYIASLAGAALENAQGFAASEALSRSLELRVEERTAELSASKEQMEVTLSLLAATLDSTADGILVVDNDGRIVSHNRKFAELWRIPAEILETREDSRAVGYMMQQLSDPEQFARRIRELYADPQAENHDMLEFRDGRVFERVSKPQVVGGKSVGRVWSFRDITNQKRSERELEHLANHDGLTGLLNRRCFEQELAATIAQVRRYGGVAAALILDVDNFKYVNDTLGHGAGDELIKSVARLLSRRLRGSDVIARLGGDEFAVLLRPTDAETANRVAIDLLAEIRHHTVAVGGQRVSMTASIGVALLEDGATDAGQLLADADLAMYEAKRAGRDGVSVYSPERAREARVEARYTWAERLRWALEEDGFELYAQPIRELSTGKITRHEVLLRMPGEDGELLTPSAFMPTAERLGLILAIDRWVVSRAIRAIAEWEPGDDRHALEINLSGTSLGDAELPALIARELEATGIDPSRLIFEVTETATIANMDEAKTFASALTSLGCKFALDDFGTGFGSFYYLKHLPVHYLKIDGDFISDLPDSETDQLVVKTIVEIARGTGKKTIAECVGDSSVLRFVEQLGIDFAQGHFIGRPEPLAQVVAR